MTQSTITHFLKQESQTLGSLLAKLNQLKQWNACLQECLAEDKALTQHCQIVNLAGTSLIVIADSPHWVTRLRFYIPELLPKLRAHPGLEKIQSICGKTRPADYSLSPKQAAARHPQKLSLHTAEILRATAQKINDQKLRKILEKIAQHSVSR